MDKLEGKGTDRIESEAETVDKAQRILKVYGKSGTPTLDREIKRMAKVLDIPIAEVI